jgi:hypothetical protein
VFIFNLGFLNLVSLRFFPSQTRETFSTTASWPAVMGHGYGSSGARTRGLIWHDGCLVSWPQIKHFEWVFPVEEEWKQDMGLKRW